MNIQKIDNLIIKYLNNSISKNELDELIFKIENKQNYTIFKSYIKTNYAIEYNMKKFNPEKSKELLLEMIKKEKKVIRMYVLKKITTYAAVSLIFLATGYFYFNGDYGLKQDLVIPEESITLKLNDGQIKIINPLEEKEVIESDGTLIGVQKENVLTYSNNKNVETLIYNELTVPYGKRFELNLSDGTNVSLNSGTSIKYPVQFIEGQKRQVFIRGEAYFKVEKDINHPFIVTAQDLKVQVLGTHFNVSAYPEDQTTNVVLVEGSVGMFNNNEFNKLTDVILVPGVMGVFKKGNKEITLKEVNIGIYTSWVKGSVVFRNASFTNIITKLERLYNVTIINNNKKIATEKFNASVNVDKESIEQVLDYFKKVYEIEYQFINNKIVIK